LPPAGSHRAESSCKLGLDVDLQHLALALLRALLALAPGVFERLAQILDQLVLLLEPEVLLSGEALLFAVDAARHFEVELAGADLHHLSFLAQVELGLLRLTAFAPFLGELAFKEFLLDGEIGARPSAGPRRREVLVAPRSRGETVP
jgi:hypothetical protein